MKQNVGGWDRNMRWIVGTGALVLGLFGRMPRAWRMGALGLAASELFTAKTRYCPANQALGIDTSRKGRLRHSIRSAVESTL